MHVTGYQLNTYLSMLVVTIIASGATLIIVHVATADQTAAALGNEAQFSDLQQSILKK